MKLCDRVASPESRLKHYKRDPQAPHSGVTEENQPSLPKWCLRDSPTPLQLFCPSKHARCADLHCTTTTTPPQHQAHINLNKGRKRRSAGMHPSRNHPARWAATATARVRKLYYGAGICQYCTKRLNPLMLSVHAITYSATPVRHGHTNVRLLQGRTPATQNQTTNQVVFTAASTVASTSREMIVMTTGAFRA